MTKVVVLSGSPSATSRTAGLAEYVAARLLADGHKAKSLRVRDLPPGPLLAADTTDPAIAATVADIAEADGIVVASPVYKAAYSGLLKALLDLLPQFAFTGKVVLPLLTGGTPAHVLALDYALRPVLSSLGPDHIVPGWFVLDKHIGDGNLAESAEAVHAVVDGFSRALHARRSQG